MSTRSGRIAAALWLLAGALCFWSFGFTCLRGSDLYWHVASGRYIVDTGTVFLTDPWSYTRFGEPWLHHEWLSAVIYHAWAKIGGLASLAVWKWGVIVVTYGLLQRTLWRETGDAFSGFAAAVLAVAVGAPFLDIRPHLYSLLGTSILLALCWRRRPPLWLPLLFLVWVNLHGGFFFGLLALGILMAPEALQGGRPAFRRAALLGLACAAAALVNPHHVEVFGYPLKYAFDSSSPFRTLEEWHPPFQPGGIQAPLYPYALGLLAVSVVYALKNLERAGWRALPWQALGLCGLTLAMSLTSRRFIPLFGICLALLLAPLVAALWRRVRARVPVLLPPALAFALGLFWLLPYPLKPTWAYHYLVIEDMFPVETVNFVEENDLSGRVFALYNWGGYLHQRTDGRMKVFIDGRADTVFDARTYRQYLQVLGGQPGWIDIVESSGAQYFLWPVRNRGASSARIAQLRDTGRWRLLYMGSASALLVRRGAPVPASLRPTPPSAWRDLALAFRVVSSSPERALQLLERALERMPYMREGCHLTSRLHLQTGDPEGALEVFEYCRSVHPDAPGIPELRRTLENRGVL